MSQYSRVCSTLIRWQLWNTSTVIAKLVVVQDCWELLSRLARWRVSKTESLRTYVFNILGPFIIIIIIIIINTIITRNPTGELLREFILILCIRG